MYILSMQNSVRWALPVMSARMLRNSRSVIQGGDRLAGLDLGERDLQFGRGCPAAPRRCAGCWLVGPMNWPLNRKDRLGWLCQKPKQRFQQVGTAQERRILGRGAAHHHVVAAAGADMAAVEVEFFRGQADLAGFFVKFLGAARPVRPRFCAGWTLTSITPGSGVTEKCEQPLVFRRQVAFQHDLAADLCGGFLDGGESGRASPRRRTAAARRRAAAVARLPPPARCGPGRVRLCPITGSSCGTGRKFSMPNRRRAAPRSGAAETPGAAAAVASARKGRVRLSISACSGSSPGQAVQRQAQADRAVAGDQEHLAGTEEPVAGLPAARAVVDHAAQRQHAADGCWLVPGRTPGPAARVPAGRAAWRPRPARWRAAGVPSTGSSGCPHRPGSTRPGSTCSRSARLRAKSAASCCGRVVGVVVGGEQRRVAPDRLAIRAPVAVQRPARKLLARILLAHDCDCSAAPVRPAVHQPADQPAGIGALGGAHGVGVPLRRVDVGGGDEGRLAAHGQPHVAAGQRAIDALARAPGSPATARRCRAWWSRGVSRMRADRHGEVEGRFRPFRPGR